MIGGKSFFDQPIKDNKDNKHMKILGKLLLVKEMTIQQVVCMTIFTLKIIIKRLQ